MGFMITVKLSTKGNVYEQDEDVWYRYSRRNDLHS